MTHRLSLAAALALAAWPALAQEPDFGDDSSPWANDGECDDARFEGAGMAAVTTEADVRADASDCRAAWAAGTVALVGAAPAPPGKPPRPGASAPLAPAAAAVEFGNDSSEWALDGECDDRRFVGQGMAASLGWSHVGRDATDCRGLFDAGSIRAWDWAQARAATQCEAIDWGDDAGEFAGDGECDDIRFEGLAVASGLSDAHTRHDAADCRQACEMGVLALRDY